MKTEMITSTEELDEIINQCQICHIAMVDKENQPYLLPFNFGYESGTIYLHSGNEGRKMDIFKQQPSVCIAFTLEGDLYHQSPQIGCSYGMKFRSVLVYGKIEIIQNFDQKVEALHKVMHKYTTNREYSFAKPSVDNVTCYKVKIDKITGRKRVR